MPMRYAAMVSNLPRIVVSNDIIRRYWTLTRHISLATPTAAPTATPTSKPTAEPSKSPVSAADAFLAAVLAEGLQLYAMAGSGFSDFDGASVKLRLHQYLDLQYLDLHYFTCDQADTVNLPSQQSNLTTVRHRGPKLPRLLTLIYHGHRFGAPSREFHVGQIPHSRTIGASCRLICLGYTSVVL
jgi:hypothetical protein